MLHICSIYFINRHQPEKEKQPRQAHTKQNEFNDSIDFEYFLLIESE